MNDASAGDGKNVTTRCMLPRLPDYGIVLLNSVHGICWGQIQVQLGSDI